MSLRSIRNEICWIPLISRIYEDDELFPLFQNRLLNPRRSDYAASLARMALTPDGADPVEVLGLSEGMRQTDHLQVFPRLQVEHDGCFHSRFFLHGWRHTNPASQERLQRLHADEPLRVAIDINNPVASTAVQLQSTDDQMVLGWAPRYLVEDLVHACNTSPTEVKAQVCRINPSPAPYQQRILIELSGRFPETYEPMNGPDFRPIETKSH